MATHPAAVIDHHTKGRNGAASLPPVTLVEALRRNIFTDGYVVDLADRTGFDRKALYRWCEDPMNASGEYRDAPLKVIVPITLATRRFDVLDFLETQVGRVACLRPVPALIAGTLVERIAGVTAEVADVQITGAALLVDGITATEAAAIELQVTEAQAALEALRLSVRAAVKRPLAKA